MADPSLEEIQDPDFMVKRTNESVVFNLSKFDLDTAFRLIEALAVELETNKVPLQLNLDFSSISEQPVMVAGALFNNRNFSSNMEILTRGYINGEVVLNIFPHVEIVSNLQEIAPSEQAAINMWGILQQGINFYT